jgi:hypothetical protein
MKGVKFRIQKWRWPKVDLRAVITWILPLLILIAVQGYKLREANMKLATCDAILTGQVYQLRARLDLLNQMMARKERQLSDELYRMRKPLFAPKTDTLYGRILEEGGFYDKSTDDAEGQ